LSGKIRARNVVGVPATGPGTIDAFLADVGQEVEAGQVLARISNQGLETGREIAQVALDNAQTRVTRLEAQLSAARLEASRAQADSSRARSDLDRAEKLYARQKMLHGEGATPRLVYEKAERELETARADFQNQDRLARLADVRIQGLQEELQNGRKILDDKQKQLEDATGALSAADVRAPVDGTVVARKGEVGKPAQDQGGDLFEIAADLMALEVVIEPDPAELALIRAGQPAQVLISDFQAESIPAKVGEIKGTQVPVEFANPNPAIKPGLEAEVRIRLD
jgi:HlyD family secretion protein